MDLLISNFWGYLKLYQVKIPQIIICGLFIELIFAILKKRGYVTYKNSTRWTRACGLLLAFSISWVINMTILGRTSREEFEVRLLPFGSYMEAFLEGDAEVWLQILMNVVMFVPIGLWILLLLLVFQENQNALPAEHCLFHNQYGDDSP